MTKLVLAFFGSCLFMQLTLAQYPGAGGNAGGQFFMITYVVKL